MDIYRATLVQRKSVLFSAERGYPRFNIKTNHDQRKGLVFLATSFKSRTLHSYMGATGQCISMSLFEQFPFLNDPS